MSRVIVKNLPKKITEDELRNHFSPDVASEITDCKLKYDVNGNFRGFAFIGFKGNDTASKVINNYNKSYITTARIIVENYDENAPSIKTRFMKNEQTKEESNGYFKEEKSKTEKLNPFKDLESDPKFQEFLKVQRNIDSKTSKSKGYIWSDDVRNDEEMSPVSEQNIQSNDKNPTIEGEKSKLEKKKEKKRRKREKGKEEKKSEQRKRFEVKLSKLPCKVKKSEVKEFFNPIIPSKVVTLGSGKGIAYVTFESEDNVKKALLKHKSFFNGKQIDVKDVTEKWCNSKRDQNSNPDECSFKNSTTRKKKEYKEGRESIADTSRLYIRNLSYSVQSEDIEDLLKGFGELTEVYVPIDSMTKKPKGFAFVSFLFPEHAIKALESLDKTIFQGRLLHIIPGASKPDTVKQFNQLSSFKQSKQIEAAKESEKETNWNALFLGTNATAEVMAKKYNVSKSQLLADTSANDSVAVRMALGETQIVNETKAFLIQHGIDLDSFNHDQNSNDSETRKRRKRSKTTILVKNLPPKTKPEEIEDLFTRYGTVNRILLPPHGVTAIVEMQNVSEAKKAFQKMSVFKFKHVPLYLEWAPINIFKSDSDQNVRTDGTGTVGGTGTVDGTGTVGGTGTVDVSTEESKPEKVEESNLDPDGRTLFVKNVSFDTSDESFKEHFSKCGQIKSAKVSRRKGTGKNGEPILLSMGFGFVVYQRAKDAEKGLRNLQNSLLDGHRLQVARSNSVGTSPVVASGGFQKASTSSSSSLLPSSLQVGKLKPETKLIHQEKREEIGEKNKEKEIEKEENVGKKKVKSNKILVRNVPFEATQKEVQELFQAFGGLKCVRLPKKLSGTGTHRGFGFVEFHTHHEAEKAMESLSGSTHLYGRRLVLEWASVSSQEENEAGTKRGINPGSSFPGDEHIPRRQKSSVTGTKNKKLKKSDLVTRLEVMELENVDQ